MPPALDGASSTTQTASTFHRSVIVTGRSYATREAQSRREGAAMELVEAGAGALLDQHHQLLPVHSSTQTMASRKSVRSAQARQPFCGAECVGARWWC